MIKNNKAYLWLAVFFSVWLVQGATAKETVTVLTPAPQEQTPALPEPAIKQLLLKTKKYTSDTIAFYNENGYTPVWMTGKNLNQAGLVALEVLKNADSEGLNPNDYNAVEMAIKNNFSPEEIDVILTNDFIHFIDDVRVGRIPPTHTARIIKITSPKTTPVKLLQEALKEPGYEKLRQMGPNIADYQSLKKALQTYRELEKQSPALPQMTASKKNLKVGEKSDEVANLRLILHSFGDYKEANLTSTEFNKDLEEAVKHFQKRHFIDQTGIINDKTRKALNIPIKDLINKIIINMERLRWLPDDHLSKRYILVNVGGYEVKAYTDNQLDLRMKAIVGKAATKTPLFYAPMKNVILNPSWSVPHSIKMRDKIPKIIQDPGYIHRGGFTVYDDNNQIIDPDQADWANEGSHLHLRQSPGKKNALGRIKLNIENPYTIYLHGTPDEKLFNKAVRNYSSGCIRLQDPTAMTSWLLNNEKEYSPESLEKMIEKGATVTVPLKEAINVYFTYQTVWQGDAGELYFSPDAYKLDPPLEKLLNTDFKTTIAQGKGAKSRIT